MRIRYQGVMRIILLRIKQDIVSFVYPQQLKSLRYRFHDTEHLLETSKPVYIEQRAHIDACFSADLQYTMSCFSTNKNKSF
jgi:hypothetical protein